MLEAPEYELQIVLVDSGEDDIEGKDNEREDLLQMFEQGEDVDEVELHGEMSMPAGIAKRISLMRLQTIYGDMDFRNYIQLPRKQHHHSMRKIITNILR